MHSAIAESTWPNSAHPMPTGVGDTRRDQFEPELELAAVLLVGFDDELDESDVELDDSELPDDPDPDDSDAAPDDDPPELALPEPERLSVL
jgi:hypothetical protein